MYIDKETIYDSRYITYNKNNFLFYYIAKTLKLTPVTAVWLAVSIPIFTVIATCVLGSFAPRNLLGLSMLEYALELLKLNDTSYLIGSKFILIFFVVILVSVYMWMRHILYVSPKAIENVCYLFHKDEEGWREKVTDISNAKWIEYFGIFGSLVATYVCSFIINPAIFIKNSTLLFVLSKSVQFAMWYIIITFITKGVISGKYLKLHDTIKFNPSIKDDPFLIRHYIDDVNSVVYFILVGGILLALSYIYNIYYNKNYMFYFGAIYTLISVAFYWIKYIALYRKLKKIKRKYIEDSKYDNVTKYLDMMHDKNLTYCQLYYLRCNYNDTINSKILPVSKGGIEVAGLVTFLQIIFYLIKIGSLNISP